MVFLEGDGVFCWILAIALLGLGICLVFKQLSHADAVTEASICNTTYSRVGVSHMNQFVPQDEAEDAVSDSAWEA